jgi:pyruvate dehydrogenase E1 component beta subunit
MKSMGIAEALREAIREEMRRDERVYCIGEDIGITGGFGGAFTVTLGLSDEFGHERILDTPISESGFIGIAIGSAMMGMRPIADFQYGDFAFCAMDQLVNNMVKLRYMSGGKVKVPMVVRVPVGATRRGAQHAQSMESYFFHLPGVKIVCPSTAYDAKGLLKTAVRDDNPVMVFEHKKLYGAKGARKVEGAITVEQEIPEEEYLIPFGVADIKKPGTDVTILATLRMVHEAISAAAKLEKEGVSVEVIDPRTLMPFDWDCLLSSVRKTGKLVIVHEDNMTGGWGAEIAAGVTERAFTSLTVPVKRVCAPDCPIPSAPQMEDYYVPSDDLIVKSIKEMI